MWDLECFGQQGAEILTENWLKVYRIVLSHRTGCRAGLIVDWFGGSIVSSSMRFLTFFCFPSPEQALSSVF